MKPIKPIPISDIFCTAWDQVPHVAMHMVANAQQMLKGKKRKLAMVQAICKKPFIYLQLSPEKLNDIMEDLTFLDTPCTAFALKSFKHEGVLYHGPKNRLANLIMLELVKTDSYLDLFQKTGKEIFLDKLIAVLYRPAAQDPSEHDIREKFTTSTVDARAEAFENLSKQYKHVILFNYVECWKQILKENGALFPRESENSGNSSGISRGVMWRDIIYDLGETAYFAGEKAAKYSFIYDALPYLNKKAKERKPQ